MMGGEKEGQISRYRKKQVYPGVVAHASNPSYPGGGKWEDLSSKPAWRNRS
jgi:hypothetical protein